MERYGDVEQRSSAGRPAATLRDASPCDPWRRCASSTTPVHYGSPASARLALCRNWRRRGHMASC